MRPEPTQISYSDFIEQVRMDEVREVVIEGLVITGITKSNDEFRAIRPDVEDPKLLDDLYNHGVSFRRQGTGEAEHLVAAFSWPASRSS